LFVKCQTSLDTGTTNGLRHGMQFGMPMREEIMTGAWRCG